MEIKGALIKISDITFAIIEVEETTILDDLKATDYVKKHSFIFPRIPIVLMTLTENEKPIYYGKKELIHLLANIHPKQIPWKKYMVKKGK